MGAGEEEMQRQIPEVVVSRLPMYVRGLTELHKDGIALVNSGDLGARLGIAPAQIRKDLSYPFFEFCSAAFPFAF